MSSFFARLPHLLLALPTEQHFRVQRCVQQVLYVDICATQYRWPKDAQETTHQGLVALAKLRQLNRSILLSVGSNISYPFLLMHA